MNKDQIIQELSKAIPEKIANDLIDDFLELRQEVLQGILGKASAGKFVESAVQTLQYLEAQTYDAKPQVDRYLTNLENRSSTLDDGLRICASRALRAIYAVRSKRDIAHKGPVKKNEYDLRYIYHSSQWVLTEIVRQTSTKLDMVVSGKIIDIIQKPISSITEEFRDRKTVFGKYSIKEEILILLNEAFPEFLSQDYISRSLDRRSSSAIINALRELWSKKYIHHEVQTGRKYRITNLGLQEIPKIINKHE